MDLTFGAAAVHVWYADLDALDGQPLTIHLTERERQQAARFRAATHAARFANCRGLVRLLLGRYTGQEPARLSFDYGPHGKPALSRDTGLHFNVSHAGAHALLAFTPACPVGVDIEEVRSFHGMDDLATRFFTPPEAAALSDLRTDDRVAGFFRCWTRKEAVVKARGHALPPSMHNFTVSVCADGPARLEWLSDDAPIRWKLQHLEPARGLIGAVALRDPTVDVLLRAFHDSDLPDARCRFTLPHCSRGPAATLSHG
jgi:4'-phosphopantetheinyl transferase